jgi:Putative restriction endonuclease
MSLSCWGESKGYRDSYRQWQEDNIAPQVVFEILSPGNRAKAMIRKLKFYEQYGVEEYYIYDPEDNEFTGLQRQEGELVEREGVEDWTSPALGIRFVLTSATLEVYYPDGRPFLTTVEFSQRAEQKQQRADRLAAQLKALGVNPIEI